MNEVTKEDVEQIAYILWGNEFNTAFEGLNVKVTYRGSGWGLVISAMYEYVPLTYRQLKALSEFFGTDKINDSRYAFGGCETCDYGSSYTIELSIEEEIDELEPMCVYCYDEGYNCRYCTGERE